MIKPPDDDDWLQIPNANESGERPCVSEDTEPESEDGLPWSDLDGCRKMPPIPKGELAQTVPRWALAMPWTEKADKLTGAILCKPAACITSAIIILRNDRRWRGVLAIDDMAKQVSTQKIAPWQSYEPSATQGAWDPDADPTRLVDWMSRAYGIHMSQDKLASAVLVVAQDRRFHPVQEWLLGLPEHDGTARVEGFACLYLGAPDTPYTRAVGRVLLVGLVARAMRPGCKLDTVVVLEGPQGLRKSTACKALVGERWFAENTCEIGTKDAQLGMHGKWLLEMPELAGMTRSQIETTKAFFSRASDWLRPPYAKKHQDLRRSSTSIATTNDTQYLRDRTGNRRYLPQLCQRIDVEGIERDRDQLFAEALAIYQGGGKYYIDDSDVLAAASVQTEQRETVDPWEEILVPWLRERTSEGIRGRVGVTVQSALEKLGVPMERRGPEMSVRLGGLFNRQKLARTRPYDRAAERAAKDAGVEYKRTYVYIWPNPDAEPDEDS